MEEELKIDYDVTSEYLGHKENKAVRISEASKDIFAKVKTKAMQVAVKGTFITFDNIPELENKLSDAVRSGYSVRVYDEDIGG